MGFIDLTALRALPIVPLADRIAATERCPWRRKILCGEVHDDNAYAMGGVAGHAGLFSSARDLHTLLVRMNQCLHGKDGFLPQSLVREVLNKAELAACADFAILSLTPAR